MTFVFEQPTRILLRFLDESPNLQGLSAGQVCFHLPSLAFEFVAALAMMAMRSTYIAVTVPCALCGKSEMSDEVRVRVIMTSQYCHDVVRYSD